ncbi:MAG: heme ABC transporter ATP-binding protein [Chitinophagaceae bacterium]
MLEVTNAGYAVGDKWLVKNVSYQFHPGKCYMLCGPNGAGKSTLMKMLSLELEPAEGNVLYNGQVVNYKRKKNYARYRSVLSQMVDISFPLHVEEVVMMGRYPHFDINPTKRDLAICDEAISMLGIDKFRRRNFLTLSGGEKQRVQFARVLTQIWEPPTDGCRILLLDEPISSLDLKYQFDFLQHVEKFIDERTIVVAILHDLNLALNYADELLLLSEGKLFASGAPSQVLSPGHIEQVFHLPTTLHKFDGANLLWVK